MRIKYARKLSFFIMGCCMYNDWGDRRDTGLCKPLWSIRLN